MLKPRLLQPAHLKWSVLLFHFLQGGETQTYPPRCRNPIAWKPSVRIPLLRTTNGLQMHRLPLPPPCGEGSRSVEADSARTPHPSKWLVCPLFGFKVSALRTLSSSFRSGQRWGFVEVFRQETWSCCRPWVFFLGCTLSGTP